LTKLNPFNKEFCSHQNWRNFAILGLILKRVLLLHSVHEGIQIHCILWIYKMLCKYSMFVKPASIVLFIPFRTGYVNSIVMSPLRICMYGYTHFQIPGPVILST